MKKRKGRPARESCRELLSRVQPHGCPFEIADGIWYDDHDRYWPVLTYWRPDSEGLCAIKSAPQKQSINAALIAQSDLETLVAESEPPRTRSEVKSLLSKIGYTMRPKLDPWDVTPVEAVLELEEEGMDTYDVRESDETGMNLLALAMYSEVEEYVRIGDPPIMKETSDRLTAMGLSADEAIGLMCKALVEEYSKSPDHKITSESIGRVIQIFSRLPEFPDEV
jgi:hypothetical protein